MDGQKKRALIAAKKSPDVAGRRAAVNASKRQWDKAIGLWDAANKRVDDALDWIEAAIDWIEAAIDDALFYLWIVIGVPAYQCAVAIFWALSPVFWLAGLTFALLGWIAERVKVLCSALFWQRVFTMKYRVIYWWLARHPKLFAKAMHVCVFLERRFGSTKVLGRMPRELIEWGFADCFTPLAERISQTCLEKSKQRLRILASVDGFMFWRGGITNRASVEEGHKKWLAWLKEDSRNWEWGNYSDFEWSGDYKSPIPGTITPGALLLLFPETHDLVAGKISPVKAVKQINLLLFGAEEGFCGELKDKVMEVFEEKRKMFDHLRKYSFHMLEEAFKRPDIQENWQRMKLEAERLEYAKACVTGMGKGAKGAARGNASRSKRL